MEGDIFLPGDPGDFRDGLDGPDFVVAVHDGDQDGLGGDGPGHLVRVHPAVVIHGNGTDLEVHHPQPADGAQDGVVFDIGGNDVIALFLVGPDHTLDGLIDGLRAPRSKDDFLGIGAVEQAGHLAPSLFQRLGGLVAQLVLTGGVAQVLANRLDHGLLYFREEGVGRQIVQVNGLHRHPS